MKRAVELQWVLNYWDDRVQKKFPNNWNQNNQWIQFPWLLEIPQNNRIFINTNHVLIVSQYIEEFPIIEELEFFFQSQYCEFTIIEDPLYNFVIYFPIHRREFILRWQIEWMHISQQKNVCKEGPIKKEVNWNIPSSKKCLNGPCGTFSVQLFRYI